MHAIATCRLAIALPFAALLLAVSACAPSRAAPPSAPKTPTCATARVLFSCVFTPEGTALGCERTGPPNPAISDAEARRAVDAMGPQPYFGPRYLRFGMPTVRRVVSVEQGVACGE